MRVGALSLRPAGASWCGCLLAGRSNTSRAGPGDVVAGIELPSREHGGAVSEVEYNQTQIEEAIEIFLIGCQPDDELSVTYDSQL